MGWLSITGESLDVWAGVKPDVQETDTYSHCGPGMKLIILVYPHYSIYAIFDFEQRAKEHRDFLHAKNTFSTTTYIYNFVERKFTHRNFNSSRFRHSDDLPNYKFYFDWSTPLSIEHHARYMGAVRFGVNGLGGFQQLCGVGWSKARRRIRKSKSAT